MRTFMRLQNPSHKQRCRRGGAVVVLVTVCITVLLGFTALAVDYGRMVATKNQLQRTCDAAALAGAGELPATDSARTSSATYYARMTATENRVAEPEITVTFPTPMQLEVTATRDVSFLFARVLGLESGLVSARATAGRSNLQGIPGVVPLAITVDDYNAYRNGTRFEERLVDNNRQNFENGTVVALDLRDETSGKSVSGWQTDLEDGWWKPIIFGQQINSALNASLSSQAPKLGSAMDTRFTRAAAAPWNDPGPSGNSGNHPFYIFPNIPDSNPRVMTIIVAHPNAANNNNPQLNAITFASVYVESVVKRAGETYLAMRILPTKTFSSENPNIIIGDENTPSIGFTAIRLTG